MLGLMPSGDSVAIVAVAGSTVVGVAVPLARGFWDARIAKRQVTTTRWSQAVDVIDEAAKQITTSLGLTDLGVANLEDLRARLGSIDDHREAMLEVADRLGVRLGTFSPILVAFRSAEAALGEARILLAQMQTAGGRDDAQWQRLQLVRKQIAQSKETLYDEAQKRIGP
jgi:hypothetical protein